MKKTILMISLSSFVNSAILISCNSSVKKAEIVKNNAAEPNKSIDKPNNNCLTDIKNFKEEMANKILANEQIIKQFKTKIDAEKINVKADYSIKLAGMEQKNDDIKTKLDTFKTDGQEKCEIFKAEITIEMNELNDEFKNLTHKKRQISKI